MTFSVEWENWYQTHDPIEGWYPELVKLITIWVREADKVLELGPGSGGNIPLILAKGWNYYGIEGSETAVRTLREKYPQIAEQIILGDFTKENNFRGEFDLVFERASIAHNSLSAIRLALAGAWASLKPGGIFISSDWFSTNHSEADRFEYRDGQFAEVGCVHFSDEEELADLFKDFDRLFIQERIVRRPKPSFCPLKDPRNISAAFADQDYQSAVWDIVCRKPYE